MRTEFSQLGQAEIIRQLFQDSGFDNNPSITVKGGIEFHKVLMQGVDFDLVYNPLKHLGFKAVLRLAGEIYASFHKPETLSVIIGLSSHFCVEDLRELWSGMLEAVRLHGFKAIHLELEPSVNGLYMSLSATGCRKKGIAGKIPAPASKDILCLSGEVGAAYMGQHVLEREKGAFLAAGSEHAKQPDLSKYKFLLAEYLCPQLPSNIIERFEAEKIYPSAGIFVTRGLADAVHHLAAGCGLGAKIYLDKIPIASQTFQMAEEIKIDPVTAALNGGDDYRILFALPISCFETLHKEIQTFDVIGHLCHSDVGSVLVSPDGAEFPLRGLDGAAE
ncbi:MAG: hypothetical protein HUJ91_05130 [Bacteroidales bacterium]|nr:hypothetical protein [Bacteroidales bacterium]